MGVVDQSRSELLRENEGNDNISNNLNKNDPCLKQDYVHLYDLEQGPDNQVPDLPDNYNVLGTEHDLIYSILFDGFQKQASTADIVEQLHYFCLERTSADILDIYCEDRFLHHETAIDRWWRMESNTWDLLFRLLSLYKAPTDDNPRKTPSSIVDSDLKKVENGLTRRLLLLMTVKQWLEHTYITTETTVMGNDNWLYTRKRIKGMLSGMDCGSADDEFVTEADPDAPFRQGKRLAPEDYKSDSKLLKSVFHCIRGGLIGKAFSLFEQCGQYWRSALYRGSILSNDKVLDDYPNKNIGNSNRHVWKEVVRRIIDYPNCDIYERASLSYLSGNLDGILPICDSWEDKVWAYYSCAIEREIGVIIGEEKSWNGAIADNLPDIVFDIVRPSSRFDSKILPRDFFCLIQESLIMDKVDNLLRKEADAIAKDSGKNLSFFHNSMIRHLSNLSIVLMKDRIIEDKDKGVSVILQAYVKALLDADKIDTAPFYLSFIDKPLRLQISSEFLFKNYSDPKCSRYFAVAERHKLDCMDFCVDFLLRTMKIAQLPPIPATNVNFDLNVPPNEGELMQSKLIEWISAYSNARTELILVSNFLIGSYLVSDRIKAANNIVETISNNLNKKNYLEDIISHDISVENISTIRSKHDLGIEAIIIEHIGYLALIDCVLKHSKWLELHDTYTQQLENSDYTIDGLESRYIELTKENESVLRNFLFSADAFLRYSNEVAETRLTGSRECPPELYSLITRSRKELVYNIWQLYLPKLVLSLFEVLTKTMNLLPSHKDSCTELYSYISHTSPKSVRDILDFSDVNEKALELMS